ncbi:QueT transporter family protein [uncultured Veillonella sp.]|uniref:QueT transporter family protein n=1 Tax=uncultured Veillonella sp. TaxID=159268 RepID=UPI0025FEE402|nr:QueT transporter family protein [uncultured Veillonella sp.]MDY3974031.1 QueT transporter family protein [Veillonella caviae]
MMKSVSTWSATKKMTVSGLCLAVYIVVMLVTQGFAFGQYQIRIATALYGLAALFPFTVVVFGLANLISNFIMGGLGPIDAIGGCIVGLVTTGGIALGKRFGLGNWIVIPFITLVPSLVVPLWLAPMLHLPYELLVSSLLVGQGISAVVSFFLVNALERVMGLSRTSQATALSSSAIQKAEKDLLTDKAKSSDEQSNEADEVSLNDMAAMMRGVDTSRR